jgi:predicted alpha/beta-hydrolase family hydrolase
MFAPFEDQSAEPVIRGFLHEPAKSNGDGLVLTHGAGANCETKLLVEMSDALATIGFLVLRFDLPFRLARPFGPPRPGGAERDREGLRRAAVILKPKIVGHIFLGGHSYGGRQASMLLTEDPNVANGLLLLSYPLHPPKKPSELRTKHFSNLTKPAFFVHGTRDPFGSIAEMQAALRLIPAAHGLFEVDGGGHELLSKKSGSDLPTLVAQAFQRFLGNL